jgi:type IV secretory pathway VirB4 component
MPPNQAPQSPTQQMPMPDNGQVVGGAMPPPVSTVPIKGNPNSTQNTLQIAEIRDGVVIMHDGSFRTVLQVQSINYDLMSPEERESVEYAYQNFLNSLYFEVQIVVKSSKIDIKPYLDKLDKIRSEHDNMLLAVLMDDYLNYIAALADQTNIMDKRFYVVVPFYSNLDTRKVAQASKGLIETLFGKKEEVVTINEATLEAAKTELKNRAQTVLSGLNQCGVQGITLNTQELIELYYDFYNPDTATRQKLANFDELTAPVVEKGTGYAAQPNLDKEIV